MVCARMWARQTGFYIVTYALGIYNLNLLLGFLTPQVDPELEGPTLPSKKEDEFRPFVRRLPEFKFWCGAPPGLQGRPMRAAAARVTPAVQRCHACWGAARDMRSMR